MTGPHHRRAHALVRGLYGIADAAAAGGDPVSLAADLLAGGCRLVQVRCKDWSLDEQIRVTHEVIALARPLGAVVFANDHPEVALATGADGVHIGQLDGSVEAARAVVGPDILIGQSTHSVEQARASTGDYVAFGPVFETTNLSRHKPVRGIERLAAVAEVVRVPLVAIGGIGPARIAAVRDAGAHAWAVIGAVAGAADRVAATQVLVSTRSVRQT